MAVSVFDLFKIGIGPSSSHTVGPMRAANLFLAKLREANLFSSIARIEVKLFGSLGATGKGHSSDKGVILGLMGEHPDTIDIDRIPDYLSNLASSGILTLDHQYPISFNAKTDVLFYRQALPEHPNALRFCALNSQGKLLKENTYLSVGGGFIASLGAANTQVLETPKKLPFPFTSAKILLELCNTHQLSISALVMQNEKSWRSEEAILAGIDQLWKTMQACVQRGLTKTGTLPGPLNIKRRAPDLYAQWLKNIEGATVDPLTALDWVNICAIAVNEENAMGGRVVTAPTNGAAGVIPGVLHYYERFVPHANQQGITEFFLTATAIGLLYKLNASISGAEVGCQGEVGVASSMAAAGLAAALGGTPTQIENAAEIAMEHHLGMTCDPVGGLVQIPCIERNAMGAVKAINAARMALHGDGKHYVSLDSVIKTMWETGADMKTKYKETSRGGLAVNIVEC
ncbi:MAG: L-serine ammonia-lyase [Pseudomonadota bacterium]